MEGESCVDCWREFFIIRNRGFRVVVFLGEYFFKVVVFMVVDGVCVLEVSCRFGDGKRMRLCGRAVVGSILGRWILFFFW